MKFGEKNFRTKHKHNQCSNEPMLRNTSIVLQGDGQLSSQDVQCLVKLLCQAEAACSEQPLPSFRRTWYLSEHTRMSKKINDALSAYAVMPNGVGLLIVLATFYHMLCYAKVADRADLPPRSSHLQEPMYKLHTICGVNKYVSGPVGTVAKWYLSHVNFLATPKGTQGKNPVLFFAEVSNDDKDSRSTILLLQCICANTKFPYDLYPCQ